MVLARPRVWPRGADTVWGDYSWISQGLVKQLEKQPNSCLSLIIAIDQLSRNIYRDNALAWPAGFYGIMLSRIAIDNTYGQQFDFVRRKFIDMPFMHSETLYDQEYSVLLFRKPAEDWGNDGQETLKFALRHLEVSFRFSHFPPQQCPKSRKYQLRSKIFKRATFFFLNQQYHNYCLNQKR